MIRDFRPADTDFYPSDVPAIRALFAQQGIEYPEPDWSQMFGVVLVGESGEIRQALLHRRTVEDYAVVDTGAWATPGVKAERFKELDRASVRGLRAQGYFDQHAWIPPKCRAFARRMMKEMGWGKSAGLDNWLGLFRRL
jgi:hypothetical protein